MISNPPKRFVLRRQGSAGAGRAGIEKMPPGRSASLATPSLRPDGYFQPWPKSFGTGERFGSRRRCIGNEALRRHPKGERFGLESRLGGSASSLSGPGRRGLKRYRPGEALWQCSRWRLAGGSRWQAEAGRFQNRSASVGDELLSRWREALPLRPGRSAMLKILEFCHAHPDYRRRWQCHGD